MRAFWKRGVLDSIVAQVLAALILAIFGAAVWAILLWNMGRAETNRWHETVRQEIVQYRRDGDTDGLIERLAKRGVEATYEPSYTPSLQSNPTGENIREHLWVRLPTHTPTWAAFEPRKRGVSLWAWIAGMAALAGCLSWIMALNWVRPLRRLSEAAEDIVQGEDPPEIDSPMELAQLSQALRQAAMAAKTSAQERKIFLAGVSHDLRQPLARIRMALAIEPLDDPDLANGVERDLVEMDKLLGQFIEWVRDGQDEIKIPVDLAQMIEELTHTSTVQWQISVPQKGEAIVLGPPLALKRALGNLIGNAEKHGQPPFSASVRREGRKWVVVVSDHGKTMPQSDMSDLLEPFKSAGARAGAGLGLAVVNRVVRHMGGKVSFRASTVNGGWTAEVEIPAKEPEVIQ